MLQPSDVHDELLRLQVHPPDWQNPEPSGRYNLVAIGGGTAGIISALGTAGLGGRAALVEQNLLGGDCLNYGCVPSKALIRAARAAHHARTAEQYSCRIAGEVVVDFSAVMERMRALRARIGHHDSAERFSREGVDVYFGKASFTGENSLVVNGRPLQFQRAVIATGARAADPNIEGLREVGYLTNETVFSINELPRRLIVIGAGPVGCELAQCFRRFGSDVHLVGRGGQLLSKEDPEAAAVVQQQFDAEGIHLCLGWKTLRAEKTGSSKVLLIERGSEQRKLIADEILVAAGRQPNVEGLHLEGASVQYTARGVTVNDRLRTSNPRIYAAGDICTSQQFTHAADAMARIAIQNALFFGRKKMSDLVIPRVTYTDPEVAHVGLTPSEAAESGIEIDSYRADLAEVDRAVVDGETAGFAVIHTRRGTGKIVGATIVAAHAGEMLSEVTLLLTKGLSIGALAVTIHPYPTQSEVLKRIADRYNRTRLTPRLAALSKLLLRWRR